MNRAVSKPDLLFTTYNRVGEYHKLYLAQVKCTGNYIQSAEE